MSSNDKTRQKLMESMRKTKAGAGKKGSTAEPEVKSKPARTVSNKKTEVVKKQATRKNGHGNPDPYQSQRRRVWPD